MTSAELKGIVEQAYKASQTATTNGLGDLSRELARQMIQAEIAYQLAVMNEREAKKC